MKIEFDKKTVKGLVVILIISGILTTIGITAMALEISSSSIIILLILLALFVGGGVFVVSGLKLIGGFCYFHRLRKYGYEIPDNRRDYCNNLWEVPCNYENCENHGKQDNYEKPEVTPISRDSRLLFIINIVIFALTIGWNCIHVIRWYPVTQGLAVFSLIILIFLDLYWLISALIFWKQQDSTKYRDDIELPDKRKRRTSIERGFFTAIILLVITICVKIWMNDLNAYVYKRKLAEDMYLLGSIHNATERLILDDTKLKNTESYKQMAAGCYISEWGQPQDELAAEIARSIEISDFSELEERIHYAKGRPEIFIRIVDDNVYIRMVNPISGIKSGDFLYEVE